MITEIWDLSVPAGLVGFVMLAITIPSGFPYGSKKLDRVSVNAALRAARQVDFLGAFFQLAASMLLVTALEEGGTMYSWRSPAILSILLISMVFWVVFVLWESILDGRGSTQEAVLPWRLVQDRFFMACLL